MIQLIKSVPPPRKMSIGFPKLRHSSPNYVIIYGRGVSEHPVYRDALFRTLPMRYKTTGVPSAYRKNPPYGDYASARGRAPSIRYCPFGLLVFCFVYDFIIAHTVQQSKSSHNSPCNVGVFISTGEHKQGHIRNIHTLVKVHQLFVFQIREL